MNHQSFFPGFDDGKAPDALRTIGEVAAALDIRQHVLRYWEEQFPMLNPIKRSGGRRYYRPEDVQLVATIDRLVHQQGYTLRGARLAIESQGKAGTAELRAAPAPAGGPVLADFVPQLRAIRTTLAKALASS
jgi:DNA-binding transcriptional MerR regulator